MSVESIQLKIKNKLGMHARPASIFVQFATKFESDIFVEKDGEKVNGKSLINLLMLSAGYNSTITVSASGKDQKSALIALEDLINNNTEFNEQ